MVEYTLHAAPQQRTFEDQNVRDTLMEFTNAFNAAGNDNPVETVPLQLLRVQ
jgi:hypothetical protein